MRIYCIKFAENNNIFSKCKHIIFNKMSALTVWTNLNLVCERVYDFLIINLDKEHITVFILILLFLFRSSQPFYNLKLIVFCISHTLSLLPFTFIDKNTYVQYNTTII